MKKKKKREENGNNVTEVSWLKGNLERYIYNVVIRPNLVTGGEKNALKTMLLSQTKSHLIKNIMPL